MRTYLDTIYIGMIFFAILFVFFLFFTFIIQYRRNGFFYVKEGIIFLTFIFYLEIAYFMVTLPLPDISTFPISHKPLIDYMQLNPFYFIQDILEYFSKHSFSLTTFIKAPPVYTTVFNVILLYPLGVFLKNLFKFKTTKVVLIGFLISLSFELLQLNGLLFIYPHPYRLFDIDDLIMNTFGTFLGSITAFIYYPVFKKSYKTKEEIIHFKPTTFKQFFIVMCDLIMISFISLLTTVFLEIIFKLNNVTLPVILVISCLYFGLAIKNKYFQTLSMKVMRFKMTNDKDSIIKRILRTIIIYTSFLLINTTQNDVLNLVLLNINSIITIYVVVTIFARKKQVNLIDRIFGYNLSWHTTNKGD